MKYISVRNWIVTVFLVVILTICAGSSAYASRDIVDLQAVGSISVTLYDQKTQSAISGGEMTLCQVAEAVMEDGDMSWQFVNGFEDCQVSLDELSDSKMAEALEKEMDDSSVQITQKIGADGNVVFTNLPVGLYLLVQTKASDGYNAVSPFLVSVPYKEGDTWNYHVEASPKVETATVKRPDTPDTPQNPKPENSKLPQTGQLNWPIPVLAISGLLLCSAGWSLRKEKN